MLDKAINFKLRGVFNGGSKFDYTHHGTKDWCVKTAKRLKENAGWVHTVHGTDENGEYIVYSTELGDVPHEHRHVRPENLVEGL